MEKLSGVSNPKSEGEAGSESSSTPLDTTVAEPTGSAPKKIHISKVPTRPADPNPFTKLGASARAGTLPTTPPTVRNSASTASIPSPLKRKRAEDAQQTTSQPKRAVTMPVADESIEQWENRTLSHVFRITLNPKETTDAANHKLIYLPNLKQELEEEEAPVLLTKERLDSAIMEAASTISNTKPVLDYLLPCWKRVLKALKGLKGYASQKDAILKEAKRLCMSNCIFAVEMPELYGYVALES